MTRLEKFKELFPEHSYDDYFGPSESTLSGYIGSYTDHYHYEYNFNAGMLKVCDPEDSYYGGEFYIETAEELEMIIKLSAGWQYKKAIDGELV